MKRNSPSSRVNQPLYRLEALHRFLSFHVLPRSQQIEQILLSRSNCASHFISQVCSSLDRLPTRPETMSSPVPMDVDRGEEQEERFGPAWLQSLLGAKFFDDPCILHLGQTKKECNYYCLDCTGLSICSLCLPDHHGHRIVQIRRSSYHDVIRLADLEQLLDVSLVQTYLINAEKVVFLNKRPRAPKHERCVSAAGQCEDCARGLLDAAFRFCCLDCKLKRLEYDPSLTFIVDPKRIQEPAGDGSGSDDDSRRPTKFEKTGSQFGRGKRCKVEGSSTQSSAALTTTVNVPINYRRRPRKGVHRIPERAPLS